MSGDNVPLNQPVLCHEDDLQDGIYQDLDVSNQLYVEVIAASVVQTLKQFTVCPHKDWPLSLRVQNVLRRSNLRTLYDIKQVSAVQLKRIRLMGPSAVDEMLAVAKAADVSLPNWEELRRRL